MARLAMDQLKDMPLEDIESLLLAALENKKYNKLDFWEFYPKQKEFFDLGAVKQERMLFAGNQVGKSISGAGETAIHLTGLYPEDWKGRRWDRPVKGWAAGESTTVQRDVAQALLCGAPGVEEEEGTGFIPKHCLLSHTLARGAVADAFDTITVRHHTNGVPDGISTLQFKSYEQGRKKFQGRTLDFVWWDEEPPTDVYTEGNARWSATGGMSYMTFTPLEGYSNVVCRFLRPDRTERPELLAMRGYITMGLADAKHMTPERQLSLLAKYPKHEWEARMHGKPMLGEGRIHVFDRSLVTFPRSLKIELHWAKIWGIDFGITHPFGAVLLAWDREMDLIYVLQTYRASGELPLIHCEQLRTHASEAPVAYPHDGHQREKSTGDQVVLPYRKYLKVLPKHATWPDGGISTEAAVMEVDTRLAKGKGVGGMVICEDLHDMFDELESYHRKDGKIVHERDDLISGLHKGIMMKRFARPVPLGRAAQVRRERTPPTDIDPWTGRGLPY